MLDWYQHLPEYIDPIVLTIGFFSLYWYALMYIISLVMGGFVLRRQTKEWLTFEQYIDLVFNLVLGMLVGSRLGYVLVYNLSFYMAHPLAIVWPFDTQTGAWIGIAGMSYYGGLIGASVGTWMFVRQHKQSFWRVADAIAISVPIGYFFGRIGNFLNGELYGRVTQYVWGMYFPNADMGGIVLRHPSQLYEAFFEGIVLGVILLYARKHVRFLGALAATYIVGYGFFRWCLEFFREPDPQIGFVFGWMTIGHSMSAIAYVGGLGLFFWLRWKKYGMIKI
jgi:phosphatidylglycerol:prolipoprotein diacylglycerol transferase